MLFPFCRFVTDLGLWRAQACDATDRPLSDSHRDDSTQVIVQVNAMPLHSREGQPIDG
jgi:hypothetical protein